MKRESFNETPAATACATVDTSAEAWVPEFQTRCSETTLRDSNISGDSYSIIAHGLANAWNLRCLRVIVRPLDAIFELKTA